MSDLTMVQRIETLVRDRHDRTYWQPCDTVVAGSPEVGLSVWLESEEREPGTYRARETGTRRTHTATFYGSAVA